MALSCCFLDSRLFTWLRFLLSAELFKTRKTYFPHSYKLKTDELGIVCSADFERWDSEVRNFRKTKKQMNFWKCAFEIVKLCSVETLELRNFETWKLWNFGRGWTLRLELRSSGTLKLWNFETLKLWMDK